MGIVSPLLLSCAVPLVGNLTLCSAFGGMVAFCIIVGDTIPHVMAAFFPSLRSMPVLWLLTDRRAIIVIFVLGVSYPLSLYRDISKVSLSSVNNDGGLR